LTTSAGTSASAVLRRSAAVTSLFLQKNLWIWPLFAAVVLAAIAYWLRAHVEHAMKSAVADELKVVLAADVAGLEQWLAAQRSNVQIAAASQTRSEFAQKLIDRAEREDTTPLVLSQSPELAAVRTSLKPWIEANDYVDFIITDRRQRIVGAGQADLIGKENMSRYREFLETALGGEATVSRPFPSLVLLTDENGELRPNVPTMFAAAPLRNSENQVFGVLAFRLRPERDFTRILNVARFSESGETYAFDRNGLIISNSRFDDDLKRLGLLPDREDSHSILNIHLRDPMVNLKQGERPTLRPSEQPLTRMAADAILGHADVDVDGYRDYRGVPSIGAWTWLPKYDFGVATEVDVDDALRPIRILRVAFWSLFALLAACSVAIFVFTIIMARLQRAMREAVLARRMLGQYELEEKIGAGGMGVVYRGHHALLRRPTAIKLLDLEKTTPETIRRFEREVQITSQLNHPNTIAVYDYGHTPEGVFYYAMEYLEGINLDQLVEQHGPQPEGRVIYILRQVCGSLNEAHRAGLIHRDVKPANIILTERGGVPDFVKLLDFGLVKAVGVQQAANLSVTGAVTGTPLYLSPEAIQQPGEMDARSDLYAVGAVGYFLLTGTPVFDAKSVVDLLMHHVNTLPEPPSSRLGKLISSDLEAILLRCLAKRRDDRPGTAHELAIALTDCSAAGDWTEADAAAWWQAHARSSSSQALLAESAATKVPAGGETTIWTDSPN
jgi:eukaryotic-like serine/threonine-protein kinase